jgi:tetratricopeptide (TPR) repeat protein
MLMNGALARFVQAGVMIVWLICACSVTSGVRAQAPTLDRIDHVATQMEKVERGESSPWLFTACPIGYTPSVPFLLANENVIGQSRYDCVNMSLARQRVPHLERCAQWDYRGDHFGAANSCTEPVKIQFMLTRDQRVVEREVKPSEVFDTGLSRKDVESLGASPDQLLTELTRAEGELVEYLKAMPNDVRALILSARIGRLLKVGNPMGYAPGQPAPDFAARYAPLLANLDRALTLEPSNAQAHYWKGRLLGIVIPVIRQNTVYYAPVNLRGAIASLREALKLAPDDASYREALALYLIQDEQANEALTVMRPVAQGRHPLYRLLSDLQSFPLPDSAVFSPEESLGLAQVSADSGAIVNYPDLRARVYFLPISATDLERFFARRWPGFRLLLQEESELPSGGKTRTFAQHLTGNNGVYKPANSISEIPKDPKDGVALMVVENRNMPAQRRRKLPMGTRVPESFGATYTELIVFNFR